jgi:SNF2 family DNA or RNA helicase
MTVTKQASESAARLSARTEPAELVRLLLAAARRAMPEVRRRATEKPDVPRAIAGELRAVDACIRDLSSAQGFLTIEEGRDLAEAKAYRARLRLELAAHGEPFRARVRRWREAAAILDRAVRGRRGLEDGERLEQMCAALVPVSQVLDDDEHRVLRVAERRVLALRRRAARARPAPPSAAQEHATRAASAAAGVPAGDDRPQREPSDEQMRPYLPEPEALEFEAEDARLVEDLVRGAFAPAEDHELNLSATNLTLVGGFEALICLPLLRGVEHYPFQVRTALQVMRSMRGRALLCDEVGLGKTIEAGIIMKEYQVRGLARRILVLTPPALVGQWRDEMREKFGLDFATHEDPEFRSLGASAWEHFDLIIASLHTAKSPAHSDVIHRQAYDLVVLDEAHHVRNRTSVSWKFFNRVRSRFALLLTATPVQNDLDELFNLITLLSPGQLETPAQFRREFVERGDRRRPKNRTKLRELLMDVMVRNSRSQVSVVLPPRRATTLRMELAPDERALYEATTRLVRAHYQPRPGGDGSGRTLLARTLQAEVGSSAAALHSTLSGMRGRGTLAGEEVDELCDRAAAVTTSSKADALLGLLRETHAKVLVFTQYRETQRFLLEALARAGVTAAQFGGGLSATEKDGQVEAFAGDRRVMVSTDVGSEGRNLQFCHTLVNYDLPWNPMRIEQRVGRVHRIGQTEPVRIFNLSSRGTVEDHMLEVLDDKLNMFELVVGELGEILGNLEDERDFESIVLDLWAGAPSDDDARRSIDDLGRQLTEARGRLAAAREYDEALFGREFEAGE